MDTEELQGKKKDNEVNEQNMRPLDYIRFDEEHAELLNGFYVASNEFLDAINKHLKPGRARSLAVTKFEECYMWIGKAIRDQQVQKTGESKNIDERV